MSSVDLDRAAENFFDGFDAAFASLDGEVIAERYLAPYLAVKADGSAECLTWNAAIAAYFQGFLDDYRARGCRQCRHRDLQVLAVGAHAAFASVTWELLREDGRTVSSWRESYNLVRRGGQLKVRASMDHALQTTGE